MRRMLFPLALAALSCELPTLAHADDGDHRPTGRPRSATVVIRKVDGGVIGT